MTIPTTTGPDAGAEPSQQMIQVGLDAMRTDNAHDSSEQGRVRRIWRAMEEVRRDEIALASQATPSDAIYTEAEFQEAGQIGERDGYESAVQDIDVLTGGDGEYICGIDLATGGPSDRHCPDAESMKARIVARFAILAQRPAREISGAVPTSVRPEVAAFALLMERELRANDHKPGWKGDKAPRLALRVQEEAVELWDVVYPVKDREENRDRIASEAADVANMAMMVADVCGCLDAFAAPTPAEAPAASDAALREAWRPGPAPADGREFWAYLDDCGIRKLRWVSAEETARELGGPVDDYEGVYAESGDPTEQFDPQWWLPLEAIAVPLRGAALATTGKGGAT